jgi:hypothetical protein
MSNPMNEPSCKPIHEPTKRLGQDALLPGNLSSKRVLFQVSMMDDEIQSCKTHSKYTQSYQVAIPVPFVSFRSKSSGLAYCWVHSHWKTTAVLFIAQQSIQFARIKRSFISAHVLISPFDGSTSSSRMACWVRTLTVKVPLLHQTNQTKQRLEQNALLPLLSSIQQCNGICNAFQMVAYLDFNQFPQNSVKADSDFRDLQRQLFNNIISDSVFSDFQRQLFINIEADSNFSQLLSTICQLKKTSSAFRMVTNKHTCIIKNKMPSIFQLISLTFKQSIKMQPIFQLIDVFVANKNDLCSLMATHINYTCQLIVASKREILNAQLIIDDAAHFFSISEGARFTPATLQTFKLIVRFEGERAHWSKLIVGCGCSEISFHFCKDCRIFHEGVKDEQPEPEIYDNEIDDDIVLPSSGNSSILLVAPTLLTTLALLASMASLITMALSDLLASLATMALLAASIKMASSAATILLIRLASI